MVEASVVIHVARWRELHLLDRRAVDAAVVTARLRIGRIVDRVAYLGELFGDPPHRLHMVIILFDHRRNIIHIPLTLA